MEFPAVEQFQLDRFTGLEADGGGQGQRKVHIEARDGRVAHTSRSLLCVRLGVGRIETSKVARPSTESRPPPQRLSEAARIRDQIGTSRQLGVVQVRMGASLRPDLSLFNWQILAFHGHSKSSHVVNSRSVE